jgi:hypothetical protein
MRMKRGQAAAFWSEKLAAHSASGVSAREFCDQATGGFTDRDRLSMWCDGTRSAGCGLATLAACCRLLAGSCVMLSIPPTTPIYFATQPADMRRSFDGLSGLVQAAMQREPASGALFVFRNRRGTQLKILYWFGDGWAIWASTTGTRHFSSIASQRYASITCDHIGRTCDAH